jgi:hypothetical protein
MLKATMQATTTASSAPYSIICPFFALYACLIIAITIDWSAKILFSFESCQFSVVSFQHEMWSSIKKNTASPMSGLAVIMNDPKT